MKRSKHGRPKDRPSHNGRGRKGRQDRDGEQHFPRNRKDSGKRFHRKKTLKETLWENEES